MTFSLCMRFAGFRRRSEGTWLRWTGVDYRSGRRWKNLGWPPHSGSPGESRHTQGNNHQGPSEELWDVEESIWSWPWFWLYFQSSPTFYHPHHVLQRKRRLGIIERPLECPAIQKEEIGLGTLDSERQSWVVLCFVLSLLLLLIMLLLGLLVVVVFLRVLRCNFLDIVGILFEDDPCGMSRWNVYKDPFSSWVKCPWRWDGIHVRGSKWTIFAVEAPKAPNLGGTL